MNNIEKINKLVENTISKQKEIIEKAKQRELDEIKNNDLETSEDEVFEQSHVDKKI